MLDPDALLLVTGATGLVGRHVIARALDEGLRLRALVRNDAAAREDFAPAVELVTGTLIDGKSLSDAAAGVTHVVHCAAKVGDWGSIEDYRSVNVGGLTLLIQALRQRGALRRFVHVSSLGVYPAVDHWGTDESAALSRTGIDGYTRSKVEAEETLQEAVRGGFPAVILRPGFIYGPHDRSVLPRLFNRLRSGRFAYLGDPAQLMNNTFVKNLVDAIFLALNHNDLAGEAFNITDGRLVTKQEFVATVAERLGLAEPRRQIPLPVARVLASVLETVWRWRGQTEAPVLSRAGIKFLGRNLDFSIEKARAVLSYNPQDDFQQAMAETMDWFLTHEAG